MLPFMKKKMEGGMSEDLREEDEYGALDAVAEDILSAVAKKDVSRLRAALEAFKDAIMAEDEIQDQSLLTNKE